ncbi:hypothetical protein N1851_025669 [Merluccius polli]|uniref:Uncharacterized protein n=1 Tax=Merluccius polli TaxID=89951 RepID=A0AA47MDL4_MERPO|nr:hypothetical protein N1851_025669 [Merluccius polli]
MGQNQDKLEGAEGLEEELPGAEGLPTEAGGVVGGGGTSEEEVGNTRKYSGRPSSDRDSDDSSEEEPVTPSIEQNIRSRKHRVSPCTVGKLREGGEEEERGGGGEEGIVEEEGGRAFPSVTQESDRSQKPRSRTRSEEQRPRKNRQFNQTKRGGMNEEEPNTFSQRKKMEIPLSHEETWDGETVEDICVDGSSELKISKGGSWTGTENDVGCKAGKKRLLMLDPQGQNETIRGEGQHGEHGIADNKRGTASLDHAEMETYPTRASDSGSGQALPCSEPSSILEKLLSRSRKEATPGLSKIKEVDVNEEYIVEALNKTNAWESPVLNHAKHDVKIIVQGEIDMMSNEVQCERTSPEDVEPGVPDGSRPQEVAGDLVLKSPPDHQVISGSSEKQRGGPSTVIPNSIGHKKPDPRTAAHTTHTTPTAGHDIGAGQHPSDTPTSEATKAVTSDKGLHDEVKMRPKVENQQTKHEETSARDGQDSSSESDRSQAIPKSRPVSELIKDTIQLHEKLHHDRPKSSETKPDVALEQAHLKVAQMKAAFDAAQKSPDKGLERKPSVRKGKTIKGPVVVIDIILL